MTATNAIEKKQNPNRDKEEESILWKMWLAIEEAREINDLDNEPMPNATVPLPSELLPVMPTMQECERSR